MIERSCEQYQQQLATYRDLGPAEWEALQSHVERCPACVKALAAFRYQDRVLGALARRTPSPALAAGVRARTLDHHRFRMSLGWRWASWAAVGVVVVTMTFGGAATASAEALPGDFLYPVKRAAERVQYTFTTDPLAREVYLQKLLQKRQEEVQRVQELEREVEITFEGRLQGTEGGLWNVGGLIVQVPANLWAEAGSPEAGAVVRVRARISESGVIAVQLRVKASEMMHTPIRGARTLEATQQHAPADQPSATPQPTDVELQASETPTVEAPAVEKSGPPTIEPPTSTPIPEGPVDPGATETARGPWRLLTATPPGMGPRWRLTATPRIIAPGLSCTPNLPIVPPGQTRTPQPPGQTRTPPAGPGRFLTATPRIVWPPLLPTADPTQRPDKPGRVSPTPGSDEPDKPGRVSPTPGKDEPDKPGRISPTPETEEPGLVTTPTPTPTMGEEAYPYPSPTEDTPGPHVRATRRARILSWMGRTP